MACAEITQYRAVDAYKHFQGAFAAMIETFEKPTTQEFENASFISIFQKLDLQVASYAHGSVPLLQTWYVNETYDSFEDIYQAEQSLFQLIHACYHFGESVIQFKYKSSIPADLLIEQGRHLGSIRRWLSLAESFATFEPFQIDSHRALCLTAFIYISHLFNPYEKDYDNYAPYFQQIISCVERVFEQEAPSMLPSFTPELGVSHPLFFAALRYRSSTWRRRAIPLILRAGRAGPWCGESEAAAAFAVIRAEERGYRDTDEDIDEKGERDTFIAPEDIEEKHRITDIEELDIKFDSTLGRTILVRLHRCKDLEGLLESENIQDQAHWEVWDEEIRPLSWYGHLSPNL